MNEEIARKINANLNSPRVIDALGEFADFRIAHLSKELRQSKDSWRIAQLQGAIDELEKLKVIRETSIATLEGVRKNGA